MEKANNHSAYQPIKPHTPESWNNYHIGPDLSTLSKKVLQKSLRSFFRALLLACSVASLYYFQDFLLRSLHLERIASSLWALF